MIDKNIKNQLENKAMNQKQLNTKTMKAKPQNQIRCIDYEGNHLMTKEVAGGVLVSDENKDLKILLNEKSHADEKINDLLVTGIFGNSYFYELYQKNNETKNEIKKTINGFYNNRTEKELDALVHLGVDDLVNDIWELVKDFYFSSHVASLMDDISQTAQMRNDLKEHNKHVKH